MLVPRRIELFQPQGRYPPQHVLKEGRDGRERPGLSHRDWPPRASVKAV